MSSSTVRASASPPLARRRDHSSLHRRVAAADLFVRSPALFMRRMSTRPRGPIVDEDVASTRSAKGALAGQPSMFLKSRRCRRYAAKHEWRRRTVPAACPTSFFSIGIGGKK